MERVASTESAQDERERYGAARRKRLPEDRNTQGHRHGGTGVGDDRGANRAHFGDQLEVQRERHRCAGDRQGGKHAEHLGRRYRIGPGHLRAVGRLGPPPGRILPFWRSQTVPGNGLPTTPV
jgi:hypothetical protein